MVIHVVHDTTRGQVAEEKYACLFEQAQEGVFEATLDGDLLDCNDAFVTMLGYGSRDELMALDMGSVLHVGSEERETFRKEIEAHSYVRNFEITVRRKDGALLTVRKAALRPAILVETSSVIRASFSTSPRRDARKTKCGGVTAS